MSLSEEISSSELSSEENVSKEKENKKKACSTRKRMSEGQRKHLVDYMNTHNIFAKTGLCPGKQGKENAKRMWRKLTDSLNAIGPATRTPAAWKQAWHDLKKRIKQKAGILRRARKETGGKAPTDEKGRIVTPLTEEEEIIFSLCGGEDWVGQDEDEEIGLPQPLKKSKVSQGCRLERNCSAPLQSPEGNDNVSLKSLDVENMSFAYMEDPQVRGTYVPLSNILQCDLGDTETQNETQDKSAAPQAKKTKPGTTDKKGGTQGKSAAMSTSKKHGESSSGEEHEQRKKSKSIRETYEDTTSQYVNATYDLASAYKAHTAAVQEQTAALKTLAEVIPSLSEVVATVGENLPAAILELASAFSVYSRKVKSTKNGTEVMTTAIDTHKN